MMIVFLLLILTASLIIFFGYKKKNQLQKYIGIALAILSLLLLIFNKIGWIGSNKGTQVVFGFSEKNSIIETVSASGKIQPEIEIKISPDVSGEIVALPVNEGDKVIQGQLLVKIKPDTYLSMLQRSEASLNSAKANLSKSEAQFLESESNYKRNKILYNKGAISASEFEQIESAYKVAKLNIESSEYSVTSAQASLDESQEALNKTSIYAPLTGTISRLNVELGERVVGTMQMAGTEILRLADLNNMEVAVEVNENDINRIDLGDTAIIEVDAFLGSDFHGVVSEIANSANVQGVSADQVTNFEVKIQILDKVRFLPGMTATVDIKTEIKHNILTIPIQAVTIRDDTTSGNSEKLECVFLYDEGVAKMAEVITGIQDNKNIHIVSGIQDSAQIVIGPYSVVSSLLRDGMSIYTK